MTTCPGPGVGSATSLSSTTRWPGRKTPRTVSARRSCRRRPAGGGVREIDHWSGLRTTASSSSHRDVLHLGGDGVPVLSLENSPILVGAYDGVFPHGDAAGPCEAGGVVAQLH